MYLTAQHVRSRSGEDGVQAYLHLHDLPAARFPPDPLTVPQEHPGRMVRSHVGLRPGGNHVLSYLDIVAPDAAGGEAGAGSDGSSTRWWRQTLEPIAELMSDRPLPWVVEAGDVHVIFNASASASSSAEYGALLGAALALWDEWRVEQNAR